MLFQHPAEWSLVNLVMSHGIGVESFLAHRSLLPHRCQVHGMHHLSGIAFALFHASLCSVN
jgi:hypothetical protein